MFLKETEFRCHVCQEGSILVFASDDPDSNPGGLRIFFTLCMGVDSYIVRQKFKLVAALLEWKSITYVHGMLMKKKYEFIFIKGVRHSPHYSEVSYQALSGLIRRPCINYSIGARSLITFLFLINFALHSRILDDIIIGRFTRVDTGLWCLNNILISSPKDMSCRFLDWMA